MDRGLEIFMKKERGEKKQVFSTFAIIGFVFAVSAGLAVVSAGFGTRWELWHFRTGFVILRFAAYGGVVALAISIAGCVLTRPGTQRRGLVWSVIGLLIGIVVIGIPWSYWRTAQHVPPIHDITTDMENPLHFVAILPLRNNAPNPSEYGGPEIAAKQRAAYPDIVALVLSIQPDQAFERALQVARSMNWQIVDAHQTEGRIEATDRTFWFGFKDDMVVRVSPADHGSRIDVRSTSRVGKSDLGTNAGRIGKYLNKLKGG